MHKSLLLLQKSRILNSFIVTGEPHVSACSLTDSDSEGTTATANITRRAVHATKLVNQRALLSFRKFIFW